MIDKLKKICTKENLIRLLMIFLILQPVLDTYILFDEKTINIFGISPSTVIRLIFIFIMAVMSLFIIKSKRQWKIYVIYIVLVLIYSILHFYNALKFSSLTPGNFNYSFSTELFYIIRMIIPLFIIVISSNVKFSTGTVNRLLNILCILISGVIVVSNILKISIGAYETKLITYNIFDWFIKNIHASHTFYDTATRGYFSFANMISALLFGLTAMLYYQLFKNYNFKIILLIVIQMIAMFMLGTKVATYGFLLSSIAMIIVYFFFTFIKKEIKFNYKVVIFMCIIFASWFLIYPSSPCKNRVDGVDIMEEQVEEKDKNENSKKLKQAEEEMAGMSEREKGQYVKDFVYENYVDFAIKRNYILKKYPYQYDAYFWYKIFPLPYSKKTDNRFLLTSIFDRLKYLNDQKTMDDLFGITYSRMSNIGVLERDFLAQYYTLGLAGFLLFAFPYLCILLISVIYIIIHNKNNIFKLKNISLIILLFSGLAGAYYCGNVLDNLTFTIIYAFFFGQLIRNVFIFKEDKQIKDDEITILALHLGVGGVEKYIASLCKMLENDYKINIICTYKLNDKPAFNFSNKIRIRYLINEKPYKEELKNSIKDRNILNIIKYLIKNIKLYILRFIRNIFAIRNIKSKYVITTRTFHNNIVNTELDRNYVKIATEHNYHNNDKKYVNSLLASIRNFDYLVCVSEELKNYYEPKVENAKVIYIPNTIDEIKDIKDKTIGKNLISVGRFSKEKGFLDLVDVINNVVKIDKDIKLTFIGDGPQRKIIEQKISDLNLENNIKLTGYIESEPELDKYYNKSNLYVMTSFTESFGIVLIEAMSHGIPCIAFDSANGAKTLLRNNGILISNRDKKKMAKSIINILNNKELYKELSDSSYKYSKKYDIVNVRDDWLKLLRGDSMKSYFDNLYKDSKDNFLKIVKKNIKEDKKQFIITANSEIFVYGKNDKEISKMLYDKKTTIIPDGISVVKGARKLGYEVKERIPGVEIAEKLLAYGNKDKKSIYFFGSKQEVLDLFKEKLDKDYPNLKIVGMQHGYEKNREKVFKDIISKKPDIVLVALGVPEQEKLIYKYLDKFDKGIFVGVGGSLDVLSGFKKRAPKIFIKTNTEWLYRILKEPKRIKRFWENNVKFLINIKDYK